MLVLGQVFEITQICFALTNMQIFLWWPGKEDRFCPSHSFRARNYSKTCAGKSENVCLAIVCFSLLIGKKKELKMLVSPILSAVLCTIVQVNNGALDNEIFKASCDLVCEWADKLFETRFSSVEGVAEHLLGNMFVNTKSKAAFTLIAALQDSGKHDLKRKFNLLQPPFLDNQGSLKNIKKNRHI